MTNDNPYDDAKEDSNDDTTENGYFADGTPRFGNASEGNPITDSAAYPEPSGEPTVTINPQNQSQRTYKLTERVKQRYENAVTESLESLETDYYDMWWQGTTLHVEYQGKVRSPEIRPGENQSKKSTNQQSSAGQKVAQGKGSSVVAIRQQAIQNKKQKGNTNSKDSKLPREPRPPFAPRKGEPQVKMPIDDNIQDRKFFDEGLVPTSGFTEFDIQERANRAPLSVEDVFVEPWSEDYPKQTPISDDSEADEMYEVEDFRDSTDSQDETLQKGERGNRYHL
jgi:hypothetical protein